MGVDLPLTGSGDATATAATDTIGGEEYPYAKLTSGAVGSTTPINTGEGVATNAMRTTIASDSAVVGAVNESAPGTDTASSGLNGRLQRVAQRLTTLIASTGAPTDAEATGDGSVIAILKRIRTLLGTLAGSVSGGRVQVDVVTIAAGDNNVANVDVVSVVPGVGQTNLGKMEDEAHEDGDHGVAVWAVRNDDLEALHTDTDGDYSPISVTPEGAVYVKGAGSFAGVDNTGIAVEEDTAHASGQKGIMFAAVRNEEGDILFAGALGEYSPVAVDASGAILVAGNPNGNAVSVGITNQVDHLSVKGDVAHGVTDANSPQKIGGQARTTNPAAVDDGDRVNATFDDLGRQLVVLGQARDLMAQNTATISNTSEATILAQAASTFHDLVSLDITNESNTDVVVTIRDATAGSAVMKIALVAKGGYAKTWTRPWKQSAVNGNWTAQLSATATVHFNVQAEKNV